MKDNLEAKFYNQLLDSTKKELPNIASISFQIDTDIDNPSNTSVIDCTAFYKGQTKSKKTKLSSHQ
jgi:hypothetical protein